MDFGKTTKALRLQQCLSQKEMAQKLGITVAALWKIEAGKTVPKAKTIEAICSVINIPTAYFYHKSFTIEDYIFPSTKAEMLPM